MTAHDLDDRHGRDAVDARIADDLLRGRGHILRRRAEARRMVGDGQVVVDGLRHADHADVRADMVQIRRELHDGIHRIVAADVDEDLDAVGIERGEDLLVDVGILLKGGQLVAAGAEHGRGRLAQELHVLIGADDGLQIDELVPDHPLDAVDRAEDRVDLLGEQSLLEDPDEARVDGAGGAAGLCDGNIHDSSSYLMCAEHILIISITYPAKKSNPAGPHFFTERSSAPYRRWKILPRPIIPRSIITAYCEKTAFRSILSTFQDHYILWL